MAFSAENVGYGPNLFYFLKRELAGFNLSMFGTISVSGAVVDRFGVGGTFEALTFAAAALTPQDIVFTSSAPLPAITGGAYSVSANGGGSGKAVIFRSLTPATCTVAGSVVTFADAGICSVAADQAGSATFGAAPRVTQLIQVTTIPDLVANLRAFIRSVDIPSKVSNSLQARLQQAEKALAARKPKGACDSLKATSYEVGAQTGKCITEVQAAALKARTSQITSLLDC